MSGVLSVTLVNRLPEIERVTGLVVDFAEQQRVPADVVFNINLSLEEVLTNIVSYAYDDEASHTIALHVTLDDQAITMRVEDDGRAFNPLEAPRPDLSAGVEERRIGGLGLHLVRSVMDSLDYRREGGLNIFSMTTQSRVPAGPGA